MTAILAQQFAGVFSLETVARVVHEAATSFTGPRILSFVPALVRRKSSPWHVLSSAAARR